MAASSGIKIEGLDELSDTFGLASREARNVARGAVQAVAMEVRNEVRKRAPRKTGNLRKAIVAKQAKPKGDSISSDVRVESGKSSKNDGFYWRFIEYGTQSHDIRAGADASSLAAGNKLLGKEVTHPGTKARPFVVPTVEAFRPQIPELYKKHFGKKLEAFFRRKAKRAQK